MKSFNACVCDSSLPCWQARKDPMTGSRFVCLTCALQPCTSARQDFCLLFFARSNIWDAVLVNICPGHQCPSKQGGTICAFLSWQSNSVSACSRKSLNFIGIKFLPLRFLCCLLNAGILFCVMFEFSGQRLDSVKKHSRTVHFCVQVGRIDREQKQLAR